MFKRSIRWASYSLSALPLLALAAEVPVNSIQSGIGAVLTILNSIVPVIFAIALIIFLWGIVKYITAGAKEEDKKAARDTMIYGIIGLVVMVGVWGLVHIVGNTFGLADQNNVPILPPAILSR